MSTIFITGASGGIGGAIARLFQQRGWNVVATMRSPESEKGQTLAALDNVLVTKLDVTDRASIETAINAAIERFGSIDVLVNNAGYGVYAPLEAISAQAIRDQFEVNVFGILDTITAILPHFRQRRSGLIINMSSMGGKITFPLGTLYHGTKFAIEGMSEALSFELRELGIGMKLIEPGIVKTDFRVESADISALPDYAPIVEQWAKALVPIQAIGSEPIVVAEVVFTAATDGADRIRYTATYDATTRLQDNKAWSEERYLAFMRNEFGITDTVPKLASGEQK